MPAHDPGLAARGVHLAALRVLHGAELGVHEVDLVPVDAAGPDHAAVAEVHRLLAAEHAGGGQVAVVLVTPVPAPSHHGKHGVIYLNIYMHVSKWHHLGCSRFIPSIKK